METGRFLQIEALKRQEEKDFYRLALDPYLDQVRFEEPSVEEMLSEEYGMGKINFRRDNPWRKGNYEPFQTAKAGQCEKSFIDSLLVKAFRKKKG